jgi:orotate phosphoribosyltransferase
MLALFTYGFPVAAGAFEKSGVSLQTLCDYANLLAVASSQKKITPEELENLSVWREDPANWNPQ